MDKIQVKVDAGLRTEKIRIVRDKKRITIDTEDKAVARMVTQMVVELFRNGQEEPAIGFKDE